MCEPCCLLPGGAFDPLGLASDDSQRTKNLREAEIKHGRLAMVAFAGQPLPHHHIPSERLADCHCVTASSCHAVCKFALVSVLIHNPYLPCTSYCSTWFGNLLATD